MAHKMVNGVRVEMTPQEEADFEASRTPSLAQAKADKYAAIRARRLQNERSGVASGGVMVRVDPESLARLEALKAAATPGQQVPVEQADGSVVTIAANALNGLITAAQARLLAVMRAEADKRAEVEALGDVAAVLAYDVESGWPA